MAEVEEFTMEVNPDDIDESRLTVWKSGGVNRLSMGIQTFDDACLKAIGRRHDSNTALKAYHEARKVFDNISIDLMFGLPGQTVEGWGRDIRTALGLRPEHISAYCLMYEKGTALTALRDSGRIAEAPDEDTEKMFRLLIDELSKSGYDHYEISNFALPGFRSQHNSSYWLQKPYIGLGPSAHSYDGKRTRKANKDDLRAYIAHYSNSDALSASKAGGISEVEILTDIELKEEYLMTRMRMREGIPLEDFKARFGEKSVADIYKGALHLAGAGKVRLSDSSISLSEEAILLSDSVILELASNL